MPSYTPGKTAFSRVFTIEGRARPDHEPKFQAWMKASGVSQSFGDAEKIEAPSSAIYGEFEEIGYTQGSTDRATSSLISRYAADLASYLLELAKKRCPADIQVHFGACTDPRIFTAFTKVLVWENVTLPSYSTDDLGSLESGENTKINETSDLSIGRFYEVLPLTIQLRSTDVVVNPLVDAVFCDQPSCGDCEDISDGCLKAYVLQGGTTGSPGTAPDVIYTLDGGNMFISDEINSMLSSETAQAITCFGGYVVVMENASQSMHWKSQSDIDDAVAGGWTEVTGFNVAGGPLNVWGVGIGAFVVGSGGYVYWINDPTNTVTTSDVMDAGVAAGGNDLNGVHALDDERAVAVGDSDTIVYTVNGVSWSAATTVTGSGDGLNCVWMRNKDEWWVGTDGSVTGEGRVYYTLNAGKTWTRLDLPGVTPTSITDMQFATASVGYIVGNTAASVITYRTYAAGGKLTTKVMPEGTGSLPGSAISMNALAACVYDPNLVIMVGETVASDGVLLVGRD